MYVDLGLTVWARADATITNGVLITSAQASQNDAFRVVVVPLRSAGDGLVPVFGPPGLLRLSLSKRLLKAAVRVAELVDLRTS